MPGVTKPGSRFGVISKNSFVRYSSVRLRAMAGKPCPHPQHQSADDDKIIETTSTRWEGASTHHKVQPMTGWLYGAGFEAMFASTKSHHLFRKRSWSANRVVLSARCASCRLTAHGHQATHRNQLIQARDKSATSLKVIKQT